MPASETFKRTARRTLERVGTTATVTNYVEETDGSGNVVYDDHGDPTRTQDNQTTGVPALFRRVDALREIEQTLPSGLDSSVDVFVWLPDDEDVREAGEPDGSGGTYRYPSRITNEATGREYDVVSRWDEGNGQYRVSTKEV